MTSRTFLSYGSHTVDEDDIAAVVAVMRGSFLTQGPAVERFEQAVAERVGAKHAVAVSSGTAALHIACLAGGVAPGDAALTQPITFVATANAPSYCGARVALADIDAGSLGMSPQRAGEALSRSPETKVVLPVHMAGLTAEAAALRRMAGQRLVIEDAAHAFGGTYEDGRPVGSCAHSDMTVFSFHPVKSMTTGEGGMVLTNDKELARRLRLFRSHGIERAREQLQNAAGGVEDGEVLPWYYEAQRLGFNYRMTDIQAALGISQLAKLDRFIARRREIALRYDEAFRGLPALQPLQSAQEQRARSAHHLYVVWIDFSRLGTTRGRFMASLRALGLGSQVHYIPLYRHPYHKDRMAVVVDAFPASEHYYAGCLSLPLHPSLSDEEVERVVEGVSRAMRTPVS